MGYFKEQVRRSKARQQAKQLLQESALIHPSDWSELENGNWRERSRSFARFEAMPAGYEYLRKSIFQAAIALKWDDTTSTSLRKRLTQAFRAFSPDLISPEPNQLTERALFWFRNDGAPFSKQVDELVRLLIDEKYKVFVMSVENPGKIVYRDAHQVAAIPFRDRKSTSKEVR